MNAFSRLRRRFQKRRARFGLRVPDVEQSTLPSRMTKLLVRVETDLGPRTVVTGWVTREVASGIAGALAKGGVEAAFVDGGIVATVAEIVQRRKPVKLLALAPVERKRT